MRKHEKEREAHANGATIEMFFMSSHQWTIVEPQWADNKKYRVADVTIVEPQEINHD